MQALTTRLATQRALFYKQHSYELVNAVYSFNQPSVSQLEILHSQLLVRTIQTQIIENLSAQLESILMIPQLVDELVRYMHLG